jgi:hypothetical protein
MTIEEALNELAKHWDTATIAQRVVLRRVFAYYGREDLIQ